ADAAAGMGSWGPYLIAFGAVIATAGALNGVIFVVGQMPMALALDGLAPRLFRQRNGKGAPQLALWLGASLGSLLLLMNYSKSLIEAFTFLAVMSTLSVLVPLLVSAAAEFRYSWRSARGWSAIAALAGLYSLFAILGSGVSSIGWGLLLFALGLPIYFALDRRTG
ncbi:MAG: amino acid permease, partial [Myxococcota bacterium]